MALVLWLAAPAAEASGRAWSWPLLGEVITPYTNGSDPYAAGQHRGVDIAAPAGSPVRAIVDGRISFAGRLPDGGLAVTIRSRDGRWLVSHLHLASRAVRVGARVVVGDTLGAVGTSGKRSAAAPHLHLGVREAATKRYVDPLGLLGPQKLAAKPNAKPRVTALERPATRKSIVRAHTTGDAASTTRHGARARRSVAARSVGEHVREGHAADGISRVAPPPIREPRAAQGTNGDRGAERGGRPQAEPLGRPAAAAPETPAGQPRATQPSGARSVRERLLLIATAFVCLVALVLRRSPRRQHTTQPPEAPSSQGATDATVIELQEVRSSNARM